MGRHEASLHDSDDYRTRLAKQPHQMREAELSEISDEICEAINDGDSAKALELADAQTAAEPPPAREALIASMAYRAGYEGMLDVMRECIAHGPVIYKGAPWLGLIANAAIDADDDPALLASCLDAGVPATYIDVDCESDLFNYALNANRPLQMALLLDRGANVNSWQGTHHQEVGLRVAVDHCRDIDDDGEGSDGTSSDEDDGTAVLRLMLERGADIEGSEALQDAGAGGIMVAVRLLVEWGSPLEEVGGYTSARGTALWRAAKNGHTKVVEYLIGQGANIAYRDPNHGKTPLDVAQEGQFKDTMALLESVSKDAE